MTDHSSRSFHRVTLYFIKANETSMIYAVGDIHGQLEKLQSLLRKLKSAGMQDHSTLVFVGEYIDRGPDTAGVLRLLINLQSSRPNTVFLR